MKKTKKNKSGFTLIEIILVVVIIGILAGIGIPKLAGKTDMAYNTKAKSEIRVLENSIYLYSAVNGVYPPSLESLLKCPKTGDSYITNKKVPLDPWGNPYKYVVPGINTTEFDLSCTSPKGDIINNWEY